MRLPTETNAHALSLATIHVQISRKSTIESTMKPTKFRAFCLASQLLLLAAACADERPSTDARLGDPCEGCSHCRPSLEPCECRVCVTVAYDSHAEAVLACNDATGKWVLSEACPGGGSVQCIEAKGGYQVSCLDAHGNEIPLK